MKRIEVYNRRRGSVKRRYIKKEKHNYIHKGIKEQEDKGGYGKK